MKTRKIISFLICIAMVTMLSAPAAFSATYQIDEVRLYNILDPSIGVEWDNNATVPENANYTLFDQPDWYDVTADRYLETGDVFTVDHVYRVIVWVKASDGYMFTNNGSTSAVFAYINGKSAQSGKAFEQGWDVVEVSYTYEKLTAKEKITTIDITGFSEPKIDRQSVASSDSTKCGENATCVDAHWIENGDTSYRFNGIFRKNNSYALDVSISPNEGYEFARDRYGNPAVNVTFAGRTGATVKFYGGGNLEAVYDYGNMGPGKIPLSFDISATVTPPEVGEEPSYTVGNLGELVHTDSDWGMDGVKWFWSENYGDPPILVMPGETFMPHRYYTVEIQLKPKDGYQFWVDEYDNLKSSGYINNKSCVISGDDEIVNLRYTFVYLEDLTGGRLSPIYRDNMIELGYRTGNLVNRSDYRIYVAFYNGDNVLVSCVTKEPAAGSGLYTVDVPENAVYCKTMLLHKQTFAPLCKYQDCETVSNS